MTKLQEQAEGLESLFQEGIVVAVDPSSGSQKSQPAVSIAEKGKIIYSERLTLDIRQPLHIRLYNLRKQLLEIVPSPDVVVVEGLPPYMQAGGSTFRTQGVVSLLQSLGVAMSTWCTQHLIEVSPQSWHGFVVKALWDKEEKPNLSPAKLKPEFERLYFKTDEHDALAILLTAFHAVGVVPENQKEFLESLRR